MEASSIKVSKRYRSHSMVANYPVQPTDTTDKFDIELSFANTPGNHLGLPLPSGRVGVYQRGEPGVSRLLGEDRINDTPAGDTVTMTIGRAFDLTITRTQTRFKRLGERSVEVGYEIAVSNQSKKRTELIVEEAMPGDWQVTAQTAAGTQINATTQQYVLQLVAGERQTFSYTAQLNL